MDEIAISKDFQSVGFTQEQAESLAVNMTKTVEYGAATKADIAKLETTLSNMREDIAELRGRVNMNPVMIASFALLIGIAVKVFFTAAVL